VIAGVDISSFAVDLVLLDDDTDHAHEWKHILLPGSTPFERARALRLAIPSRSWWEDQGVWLVGYEDPVGHHAHTAKAMGLMLGAFAALLPSQLPTLGTQASEWQPRFTGWAKQPRTSAERKALIRNAAHRRGFTGDEHTQDLFDAYGIAWVVRALNDQAIQRGAAA
jgi:hypothetical protein